MSNNLIRYCAGTVLTAGAAFSVQAQQAPDANSSDTIERIVVTATRSAAGEEIQQVPMALTAIRPESLEQFGLGDLTDISRIVPSMDVQSQGPGVNNITMRGLVVRGISPSEIEDSSLVAVYVDDMPVTLKSGSPDLKVLDLERVEVLRGPQGTLYGAGAMAGTVRQITRKPDVSDMFGTIEAVASETSGSGGNNGNLRGMINIPLKEDVLGLRITAYTGADSGYIRNILTDGVTNRSTTDQLRVALRLVASPDLTVDASMTGSDIKGGLNDAYSGLAPYTTSALTPEKSDDRLALYNLAVNYNLGSAQLVSSSTYMHRNTLYVRSDEYNTTAFIFPGQPLVRADYTIGNKVSDFAQEVRLNSRDPGPWKWTAGGFFETGKRAFVEDEPTRNFDALYAATYGFPGYSSLSNDLAFSPDDQFSGTQNSSSHQAALFAESTYTLFGRLDLTAGVRLFREAQDFNLRFTGYYGNVPSATPAVPLGVPNVSSSTADAQGANPRFAAAYHIDPDHLLYAEVGRGFRYGGNNQPVPEGLCGITAPKTFGPDSLWSYEIGSKNTLFNQHVTANLTGYLINWKNVQIADTLPCSYYFTQNAGMVRSEGVELETMARLTRHLSLGFNSSYTNAYAASAITTPIAAQDIPQGTRTPYAPRFTASLSARYSVPVNESDETGVSVSYAFRSNAFTDFAPTGSNYAEIPSSNMLNATWFYKTPRYELGLFGTNLTNGTRIVDVTKDDNGLQPGNAIFMERPRTIGLRLKARF